MKKNKQNNVPWIVTSGIIVLLLLLLSYRLILNQKNTIQPLAEVPHTPTIASEKKYRSNFLKIEFSYPKDFEIEEIHNSIYLEGERGDFTVDRISTNYKTLGEHIDGLEILNKVKVMDREELQVKGVHGIKAIIKSPLNINPDTYVYFFYPAEWQIYAISTDSEELIPDLDKIAQSFTYSP